MRNLLFVALAAAGACALAAQTRADLEGTWRMDKVRSQYPAESATEVIHQHGDAVDITITEKQHGHWNSPMQIHLTTDGKPGFNTIGGNRFTSTTHWDHGRLLTFIEGERNQHMTEIRELSADGRLLTVTGYHQDELRKPYYVRIMVRSR